MEYLSNSVRNDLIIDAIEGGSNYWYLFGIDSDNIIRKYIGVRKDFHGDFFYSTFSEAIMTAVVEGDEIPVYDIETREMLGKLSLKSIEEGEEKMYADHPQHFGDILCENNDAITADVWFQYCVMGELIFG